MEQAKRVLEIVDAGLTSGLGDPIPGRMCVEAAVCFAFGEGHDDEPRCVDPRIRKIKITINDAEWWDSDIDRAKGLRKLAILQLGTIDRSMGKLDDLCIAAITKKIQDLVIPKFECLGKKSPAVSAALKIFARHCKDDPSFSQLKNFCDNFDISSAYDINMDTLECCYEASSADDLIERLAPSDENGNIRNLVIEAVEETLIKMKVPGIKFLPLLKIKAKKPKLKEPIKIVKSAPAVAKKPVKKLK